jgi:glycerol-1-phosphate dehydrogenase [NAD(P)+]
MNVVEFIQHESKRCDALVAVGSGTINDLCKYAAFAASKPYIVFPTAASMNGYLSANVSISVEGYKKTLPAQMPKAVFCDLEVIAAAPLRLNKSGLGDSLARPTAQADWLMSHLVLGTPYDNTAFELLKDVESELFDSARGIAKRDAKTTELLIKTLLLSGLGMTIEKGSYPASQGEHMIAHTHEMMLARRPQADKTLPTLHGEEIGVTTVTMANLQQSMLRQKPSVRPKIFPANALSNLLGDKTTKEAAKAYRIKAELMEHNNRIVDWSSVAAQLEPVMFSSEHIVSILKAAEAPYQHETLGWNNEDYNTAIAHACFLRERFTFLDLVL